MRIKSTIDPHRTEELWPPATSQPLDTLPTPISSAARQAHRKEIHSVDDSTATYTSVEVPLPGTSPTIITAVDHRRRLRLHGCPRCRTAGGEGFD